MHERKIKVSISRTINMGNFNSLKVEAGLEESVQLEIPYDTEYKRLWNTVNAEINRAIAAFDKTREKQPVSTKAGGKP